MNIRPKNLQKKLASSFWIDLNNYLLNYKL